jgi:hypothetical protein
MKSLGVLTLACLLLTVTAEAQTDADKALVASLAPEKLRRPDLPNRPDIPWYVYKRADLDGSGRQDYIIGAYMNGFQTIVRVIRPDAQKDPVVDETSDRLFLGDHVRIRLEDLDGDGKPEIIVSNGVRGGDATAWLFGWRDRHLVILGPTRTTGQGRYWVAWSQLENVEIGVDSNGKPELVSYKRGEAAHPILAPDTNGIYQPTAATVCFARHHLEQGEGYKHFSAEFTVSPQSRLTISVVNGERDGRHRSSGPLYLNGQILVSSELLKNGARAFTIPALSGTERVNLLVVRTSEPDADITVTVTLDP